MANNKRGKVNAKGRNASPTDRFTRLPHKLLSSPAYRSLSPNARALLVELSTMDNGGNNGRLWLSERDAARRMGVSCQKVARNAFTELASAGVIVMTRNSNFDRKTGLGRAREWALTWLFNQAVLKPAGDEWKAYSPTNNIALKRMDAGLRALSDYRKDLSAKQNTAGNSPDTTPYEEIVQGNSPDTNDSIYAIPPLSDEVKQGDMHSHIAVTMGTGLCAASLFWWRQSNGQTMVTNLLLCLLIVDGPKSANVQTTLHDELVPESQAKPTVV